MLLSSIEKIMQVETCNQERKTAAEAEARQIVANAERNGLALLKQVREDSAENGREKMRQAEIRAAQRSAEIAESAKAESDALQERAAGYLDEAAEFIAGRVVNH